MKGRRKGLWKKVLIKQLDNGTIISCPNVYSAANFLGTSYSSISYMLKRRKERGKDYKGFIVKFEDDPISWKEIEDDIKNSSIEVCFKKQLPESYKIFAKNMKTGDIKKYDSISQVLKEENMYLISLYQRLIGDVPIPWKGKCFRVYTGEELTWPNYPLEVVDVFSRATTADKPLKVTGKDGSVEYVTGMSEWISKDPPNRKRSSRFKERNKDGYVFERIDLTQYK